MMFLCLTGWTTFIYTLSGSTHVGKFLLYLTNYYFPNTYFIVSYCLTAQINVRRLVVLHLNSSESWSGHFCVSLLAGRQPFEGSALFGFVHWFPSSLVLGPYQRYKNVCDLSPAASSFQLDGYRLSLSYDLFRLDHCRWSSISGNIIVHLCVKYHHLTAWLLMLRQYSCLVCELYCFMLIEQHGVIREFPSHANKLSQRMNSFSEALLVCWNLLCSVRISLLISFIMIQLLHCYTAGSLRLAVISSRCLMTREDENEF